MIINTDNIIQMSPLEVANSFPLGDHPRPCDHCGGVVRLRDVNELRHLMPHLIALGCTKCGADLVMIDVKAA
jgi:hypothetical protein